MHVSARSPQSRYLLLERLRRQVSELRARGVPDQTGLIGLSIADLDLLLTLAEEHLFTRALPKNGGVA